MVCIMTTAYICQSRLLSDAAATCVCCFEHVAAHHQLSSDKYAHQHETPTETYRMQHA